MENPLVIAANNPAESTVLPLGEVGTFDHAGIMPSCVLRPEPLLRPQEVWMYYTGWSQRMDVPYHNSIGLAISHDNGKTFEKYSRGPLFGSTLDEPYFTGTPYVKREGQLWKCWYYSATGWTTINNNIEPRYKICYAESFDGIAWQRYPDHGIKYSSDAEGGICSPSVIYEKSIYHMWYSYRAVTQYRGGAGSYRIGYATSEDGKRWSRHDDKSGIRPSKKGWDKDMICYSYIITYKNRYYLFYNGNNFGEGGIGVARGPLVGEMLTS